MSADDFGGEPEAFRVLCADPPWRLDDQLPGPGRGATKHYATLSVEEICAFPLPPLEPTAHLFLWRLSSMVEEAYRVVRAWGFVPKSEIVWIKRTKTGKRWFGMGHQVRAEHETCIIATRGKGAIAIDHGVRSTFEATAETLGEAVIGSGGTFEAKVPDHRHSAKPIEFGDIVERLCPGPYVEIFARTRRPGWTCLGNEV